ncbi:MAG: hypothetical protein D6693_11485 [Planctomycetota bacterium]|nr:MAG: hypothetical protein D6693_11485 [Planctomycetota bacterium]
MATRLGQVLVESGVLTEDQVEAILRAQEASRRPFGALAEEMFHVPPEAVEQAWARQYEQIAEAVNPADESLDDDVLALVDRRQAWQFRLMPLRREGGELRVATTRAHLPRAMRFALRHFGQACYFVLTTPEQLAEALMRHFPMPGMTAEAVLSNDAIYPAAQSR